MKVRHSQRCNETPLTSWIICESTGEVCCADCTCMAGLGEVCTHVAAILFYVEATTRLSETPSCTQEQCKWVIPSFQRDIPYLPIKDIDFTSAKSKKRKLDDSSTSTTPSSAYHCGPSPSVRMTESPSSPELKSLYQNLSKCGSKPVILSLVPEHADNFVPKARLSAFPEPLQSLSKPEYLKLGYTELLTLCESTTITVTQEMALADEEATREQSASRLWYTYRSGRVTASKMKQVCHTNPSMAAQSLIKSVCYPEAYRFTTKATKWGCTHEKAALEHYKALMQNNHCDVSVNESGFVINSTWPHLGATPDGIVNCSCCGKGAVEIKCPFCPRKEDVEAVATKPGSCLLTADDGTLYLDHTHQYYYQIQTQIFVCDVEYGDFCVCTFPTEATPSMHYERIYADKKFWESCVDTSTAFFKHFILPELLGKWYTRPSIAELTTPADNINPSCTSSNSSILYCYCQKPEDGSDDMIGCDNETCPNQWYHLHCFFYQSRA